MRKQYFLFLVFSFTLLLVAEPPAYLFYPFDNARSDITLPENRPLAKEMTIVNPKNNECVPLLSKEQKAYLDMMPREARVAYFANAERRKEMQSATYMPLQIKLEWECNPFRYYNACGYHVFVSEHSDMSEPMLVEAAPRTMHVILNNLKINTHYYWLVRAEMTEGEYVYSPINSFSTEAHTPRLLYIPGVPNARDMGGYIGLNGRRIRQGLIYRTAGLNDNAQSVYMTRSEVEKKFPHLLKIEPLIAKERKACEAELASQNKLSYIDNPLNDEWTVFLPAIQKATLTQCYDFLLLDKTPETYIEAKPIKRKLDADKFIVFKDFTVENPAFLIQEFDSDVEGAVRMGFGADWYWALYVNDVPVYDCLQSGNVGAPIAPSNHTLDLKIKKGHNVVKIVLLSGSSTWRICYDFYGKNHTRKNGISRQIGRMKRYASNLDRIPTGEKLPGKQRMNDNLRTYVTKSLGVKSDIDLRSDGECLGMKGSPAGSPVTWFHYSSSAYAGMSSKQGKEAFTKVFKVFLDKKNYPIAFHCIAGQDRTGAVAFILNALLGVEEERLWLDWETTGFWNASTGFNHAGRFNNLVKVFDAYEGKTINERVEKYVLELGFTQKDIENFRNIMLE